MNSSTKKTSIAASASPFVRLFAAEWMTGRLRSDLPLEVLSHVCGGLIIAAFRSLPFLENGVERASAVATETLLAGIRSGTE